MDNIYALIARLRKARRQHVLASGSQALFYELLAISNEERWPKSFKVPAGELCSAIGCSEKTLGTYQHQLIGAGLIAYKSGKHKREPSEYSFDGSCFGSSNGVLNGSNNYHHSEHQSVSKTPDLLIQKRKSNTNTFQSSNNYETPAAERERMIEHFCNDKKTEKEKSCAEKENPPTAREADTAFKNLYVTLYDLIRKDNPDRAGTDEQRFEMLELFWAENIDDYARKFPPWKEIITHFRNWVPKYSFVKKQQENNSTGNGKITTAGKANANYNAPGGIRQRTEDKRNQLRDLKAGSTEFLRRADL